MKKLLFIVVGLSLLGSMYKLDGFIPIMLSLAGIILLLFGFGYRENKRGVF